ncbi:TrmH family RNA methyltransferase [Mangrovivirga sp. M17]|uniref:TrmH family RNA methyltransferase n=1 Tax=Mangrovivirga halotolerans TaxID=2993936 RepID=A0ABT3RQR2_9BACT|nr:TrmH family RNA methyltransferase [Mangrovivirga halotolerans]MCX2743515.1 TrmH family RNA methyltransferase [Mangrovivirga halotolerans]
MIQLDHKETPIESHDIQIVVICDEVENPDNIGMILRVADGFGVEKVIFKSKINQIPKKSKRVSRSAWERIKFDFTSSIEESIKEFKIAGYHIVAVELTNESADLRNIDFRTTNKLVLVIGNESRGVSAYALNLCDDALMIPLFGEGSSLNVVNALSISLFEIIRQATLS